MGPFFFQIISAKSFIMGWTMLTTGPMYSINVPIDLNITLVYLVYDFNIKL